MEVALSESVSGKAQWHSEAKMLSEISQQTNSESITTRLVIAVVTALIERPELLN